MRLLQLAACLLQVADCQTNDRESGDLGRARWKKKPKPKTTRPATLASLTTTSTKAQRNKDWNEFSMGNQQYR